MDIDPGERLVDIYSEMRATDPDEYQHLSTIYPEELGTWHLVTRNEKFRALILEALRLRQKMGLD